MMRTPLVIGSFLHHSTLGRRSLPIPFQGPSVSGSGRTPKPDDDPDKDLAACEPEAEDAGAEAEAARSLERRRQDLQQQLRQQLQQLNARPVGEEAGAGAPYGPEGGRPPKTGPRGGRLRGSSGDDTASWPRPKYGAGAEDAPEDEEAGACLGQVVLMADVF
jgi:hypothetical protein